MAQHGLLVDDGGSNDGETDFTTGNEWNFDFMEGIKAGTQFTDGFTVPKDLNQA